ncbi:PhzF family phenazine biosynthesis protein [Salarchaeum sp. JOR-1]|uniref:PhzF family phenazine biosynthesis protein n=1 Tax=Salarchaeum sp. JOR-1 TaxID=2599399 RepID=UPI001198B101|nr:PhzF family phenazine biosynthesis protein [Salarchaeum sp. JOR-1]QDX39739.1 PhzF family phenazine biosynthesis protein [Salarchaeum sp. JOR-1]
MSESVRAFLVDAFTDEPCAGNPAGVVPDADGLSDDQMLAVASELGASETAFVRESETADRRVRYFSPTTEVDLCGHATIASHTRLFESDRIGAGTHTLETNVGTLDIELAESGTVWMTQNPPEIRQRDIDSARAADALGVPASALVDDLPFAVASTGLPFLVVGVEFLSDLGDAEPNFDALEALCEDVGAEGVYAFTFDTLHGGADVHGRAFCPPLGIDEDPVTGTASGATAAYLDHVGAFHGGGESPAATDVSLEGDGFPDELVLEQGHFLDRPGTVRATVDGATVRVGGTATTALDGTLRVPDDEGDEILEA